VLGDLTHACITDAVMHAW